MREQHLNSEATERLIFDRLWSDLDYIIQSPPWQILLHYDHHPRFFPRGATALAPGIRPRACKHMAHEIRAQLP